MTVGATVDARAARPQGKSSHRYSHPMATEDIERLTIAPIVGPDDPRRFTDSGIEIKPLYTEEDLPEDLAERLGEAGSHPHTPRIPPHMYRKQLRTIRQHAGYPRAKEINQRHPHPAAPRLT